MSITSFLTDGAFNSNDIKAMSMAGVPEGSLNSGRWSIFAPLPAVASPKSVRNRTSEA